ncbi:M3 family metallopeptidase [Marivita sp. GX14005]|uniref:M3 family metallopeptidase n=1 Tax=Marivita sp. GX14005 TaxID=2942276 RepID=UPI002018CC8D|nr:M3 family metallopeptidase [Marivita sp. GX14005]MCL3881966.1 M3 family metallopeptidase [Marivita sp. GX14005]
MTNPLLEPWTAEFAMPPFGAIRDDHFGPAIEAGMARHLAEIDDIAGNAEPPDFANTIEAFLASGAALDRVLGVFYNLAGADSTPEREALMREFSPRLAEHSTAIYGNRALFERIEAVWQARDGLDLAPQQERVLMLTRRSFLRAGAGLEGQDAVRMRYIKSRLASLGTQFGQNLLADERDWQYALSEADLKGLPEFVTDALHAAGRERGANGPVLTLSRSVIVPFLQFCPDRAMRETAWRAWISRGERGGATDNRDIAAEILALRHERARLLGYPDFASFKLETEMAKTPAAVRDLLIKVWKPAKARADADARLLEKRVQAEGVNGPLRPWDWRYYAEARRQEEFALNEAEVKPYFQLDRMIEAAFSCATRLFGLEFTLLDVPLYHPDCRAWEVTRNGAHVAVFIGDYFARASKRSGAWCSAFRAQREFPDAQRPIVVNVCNFAKSDPALLSYDDARTLFHEFGHALHQMLSDVRYDMISGTSVARDFVELPSQLFEHWLEVPEVLRQFATHADTGEPMPADMLEKVLAAATYDMGFQTVEYLASALVDLAFHEGAPPEDVMARQQEVLGKLDMPGAIVMRHASPHFAHVFTGDGYSSGYYSYMWSEVMDADAFAAFQEAGGPFDAGMAKKLERHILSAGGSEEADVLYKKFRGRMPGVEALLKGRGLAA